jgi:hypothetical protein
MTDHDSPDTELAPTEQASPPTTELPPASHAAEAAEAWSLDDTAEVDSDPPRRVSLLSVGLVGLVVVVAGALIFFAATFFGSGQSKHVERFENPTTTVRATTPPPPPAVVTVTAPPPVTVTAAAPTTAAPALSSTDQQFLTVLQNMGLGDPDPAYAISHAHATCEWMGHHRGGQSASDYVSRTTIWTGESQAVMFAEYSAVNYCPQFASE